MRLSTHMRKSNHEQKLVWKDQAAELYVINLVSDDPTLDQFELAIDEGNVDSAYDTLARLIENAASDANMISRGRLARAKLNLPMPQWFESKCRAQKAHLRRLTKFRQSTRTIKKEYNSLCSRKNTIANKVINLNEARDVQVFDFFRERERNGQTSIPVHIWTDCLKEQLTPNQTSAPRDLVPRLPCAHQALSDRLCVRQITPADIAIPPGPGGRYRKGSNINNFLQQSPDHPPLFDISYTRKLTIPFHRTAGT